MCVFVYVYKCGSIARIAIYGHKISFFWSPLYSYID